MGTSQVNTDYKERECHSLYREWLFIGMRRRLFRVNEDAFDLYAACFSICPNEARSIGKIMHTMIALAIKKGCAERKQNELFI